MSVCYWRGQSSVHQYDSIIIIIIRTIRTVSGGSWTAQELRPNFSLYLTYINCIIITTYFVYLFSLIFVTNTDSGPSSCVISEYVTENLLTIDESALQANYTWFVVRLFHNIVGTSANIFLNNYKIVLYTFKIPFLLYFYLECFFKIYFAFYS